MLAIRDFLESDWTDVHRIYAEGIATGQATFEAAPKAWAAWCAATRADARLVATAAEGVVGWASLAGVSTRPVYAGVAEVSVYVSTAHTGRGIGRLLLEHLVERSEAVGVWTLQASIFPENRASVALHARQGFRVVGTRERIARMPGEPAASSGAGGPAPAHGQAGRWRDVVLMERRSEQVGLA